MNTNARIKAMLKQNTGQHFLDSGGAYGRNWQRNQTREFQKEELFSMEVSKWKDQLEIEIIYNVYHYLSNMLRLDDETQYLNRKFQSYGNLKENEDKGWLTCMEDFCEDVLKVTCETVNTYNYENLLSQVLQYTHFQWHGWDFVILQIHGGCDVRGGYTKPHIFKVIDYSYFVLGQSNVSLHCTGSKEVIKGGLDFTGKSHTPLEYEEQRCTNNWSSDDSGVHFYYEGCSSNTKPLEEYTEVTEKGRLICKECGGQIVAHVIEQF